MITAKEIIRKYLADNGFDGLFNDKGGPCGCNGSAPCGGGPHPECCAAHIGTGGYTAYGDYCDVLYYPERRTMAEFEKDREIQASPTLANDTRETSPGNEDQHYAGSYQPMAFGAEFDTPLYQLNKVLKYLVRHPKKGKDLDLKKAIFFIEDLMNQKITSFPADRVKHMLTQGKRIFPPNMEGECTAFQDLIHACSVTAAGSVRTTWALLPVIAAIRAIAADKYEVLI